ncbi:hypothetical protein IGL76_000023 [Enterococcus sp. DIV2381]|uniref:Uncharacterized protein n=1 Tax=Candidatus Enterococcus mangumiae TaxID=2230878 RepID=A0ABZ2SVN0_9ENTE
MRKREKFYPAIVTSVITILIYVEQSRGSLLVLLLSILLTLIVTLKG